MGILNVTDDSFYDGGKYTHLTTIIERAQEIVAQGATIIDIGAQSSRPGSKPIGSKDEAAKLIPAINAVKSRFPDITLSADTYWKEVAQKAIEAGADIINDVSGGSIDAGMYEIIAETGSSYILNHMKGTPETMQLSPVYSDILQEITDFFEEKTARLKSMGIKNIIIDPGFGFGKSINDNYRLLHGFKKFKSLGFPLLAGASRKSMITKVLGTSSKEALNGTTVINTIALLNGADILRVHDVKEACEAIALVNTYKNNNP